MPRLSRYSLAKLLVAAAERRDLSGATQAVLVAAAASVARDELRDDRTPHRRVCDLARLLRGASGLLESQPEVH